MTRVPPGPWVPLTAAGAMLVPKVSYQAVQSWIKSGFSAVRSVEGITHVHLPSLVAWRAKFKLDPEAPGHGGTRPGAGRKPASQTRSQTRSQAASTPPTDREPADAPTAIPSRPLPLDSAGLRLRLDTEVVSKAEIDKTYDSIRLMAALREAEREAGATINAEEARAAWGEILQGFKDALEEVPGRCEVRACAELSLTLPQGRAIREIMLDELRSAVRELLARDWKPPPVKTSKRR